MTVNLGDARDKLSKLVQAVVDGEQVTICKNGKPVVDMVPTKANNRGVPKFGTLAGQNIVVDPNWWKGVETEEELEAWLRGEF